MICAQIKLLPIHYRRSGDGDAYTQVMSTVVLLTNKKA